MDEVIRPITDADIVDLSHYLARLQLKTRTRDGAYLGSPGAVALLRTEG